MRARTVVLSTLGVAAAAGAWRAAQEPPPAAVLASASPDGRLLEARTSLDLPHAAPARDLDRAAVSAAIGELQTRDVDDDVASALATLYAARAEPGDPVRARTWARTISEPWKRQNDLGVVSLAGGDPEVAYEHFAQASELAPDARAPAFNVGLALEGMPVRHKAREALLAYERLDPGGAWAQEARDRAAATSAPTPAARELPLDQRRIDLVGALIAASGPEDLAPLRPLAAQLATIGDTLPARELEFLDALDPAAWERRRPLSLLAAEATRTWVRGEGAPVDLAPLRSSGDPLLVLKALQFEAYRETNEHRPERARQLLAEVEARSLELGALDERLVAVLNRFWSAWRVGSYLEASRLLALARSLLPPGYVRRESDLLFNAVLLARDLDRRAAVRRTAREAIRLREREGLPPNVQLPEVLGIVAGRDGRPRAERAYIEESIALAAQAGKRNAELGATLWLAHVLARRGLWEPRLVERVEEVATTQDPHLLARGVFLDARSWLAEIESVRGRAEKAVELAAAAEEGALELGDPLILGNARETHARVLLAAGRPEEALRPLRAHMARLAEALATAPDALSFVTRQRKEAGISLLLARTLAGTGDVRGAFEAIAGTSAPGPEPGTCHLAVARDRQGLFGVALPAGRTFAGAVDPDELRDALEESGSEGLAALEKILGTPWSEGRCDVAEERVILARRPSTFVGPMPRLATSRRPRATVLISVTGRPLPPARSFTSALAVHDPAPAGPDARLAPLPLAAEEARDVLSRWAGGRELTGAAATPRAVVEAMAAADLVHIATHGDLDAATGATYLVLAGDEPRLDVLDLLDARFPRAPLVVLGACDAAAAGELEHQGEGLPWALLQAGASAVIAADRPVADRAALEFSRALHRALGAGVRPDEAYTSAVHDLGERWPPDVAHAFGFYY